MAGYSGTPLPRKLGLKPGHSLAVLGAPPGFRAQLGDPGSAVGDPGSVLVTEGLTGRAPVDVILSFVRWRDELAAALPSLRRQLAPAGGLWIAWPKRSAAVATDMTEHVVREIALPTGLVDNKVCAIDGTWSALRLVIRLELRVPGPA